MIGYRESLGQPVILESLSGICNSHAPDELAKNLMDAAFPQIGSIALQKLLPKPSPGYGSRFENNHRHEGAPLADIPNVAFDVAFGGKADMSLCAAHVCF